ncbi:hypothetical protein STEG23_034544 [Scotinomys teguina]
MHRTVTKRCDPDILQRKSENPRNMARGNRKMVTVIPISLREEARAQQVEASRDGKAFHERINKVWYIKIFFVIKYVSVLEKVPQEPPPKPNLSPVLRKPLSLRVAFICLSLVLVTCIVLQAVFYPMSMNKILHVKSDAEILRGRVDNISTLGSVLEKDRGRVEKAEVQMQILNTSLTRVRSQILSLRSSMAQAITQISVLASSWEEVDNLSSKLPELQRDLDKVSTLNAKVRGLQSGLENVNKVLQGQSDILEMLSRGWKYFGGNFYYFSHTPKTWYSAEQFCISRDAHLTSVTSESEQEFLYKAADGLPLWIGLTKAGSEGDWYWVDKTLFNMKQSERVSSQKSEPPPKPNLSPVLRKPLSLRVAFSCLSLVLVTCIVLQAVFYPMSMNKILHVKSDAEILRGRVDNISTLGSVLEKDRGRVEKAEVQMQILNTSLTRVRSQILSLRSSMAQAIAQISVLASSWEEVDNLSSKLPELQRDLDKASTLNAKVRGLQSGLENVNKVLQGQSDILEMLSRGWKYFGGNFYYFSHTPKTWYSAEQFCISRDAHLTSVTSESEQEFLYKAADGLPLWIGLTKAGSEGDWYWVDKTLFNMKQSERFWILGEPNNTGNNEHCANIRVSSPRAWNDASCDNKFIFVCKRPHIQAIP